MAGGVYMMGGSLAWKARQLGLVHVWLTLAAALYSPSGKALLSSTSTRRASSDGASEGPPAPSPLV
jgi:hypothetical protein